MSLRKHLLETCQLHTVLNMPGGTFTGAGVKTVVLFFEKGRPTKNIWYYDFKPERNLGKTNPLNDEDLKEFVELEQSKADSDHSWTVTMKDINTDDWDLSVSNPHAPEEDPLRPPEEILAKMEALENLLIQSLKQSSKRIKLVYFKKISSLQELKQSLLEQAFQGKLTEAWRAAREEVVEM